ncbi:BREX-1 system adenine-specific DNA-methyltransferase PglX [Enterobacter mori]|uniref:BREX-1 system adenine-specific DNA-methyltransferase PglX n=1 Tax=Enterobacter mori TaxID=539813 RepID=UPI0021C9E099|nr:BREX-1 system adenine-specific DNA-methyltransferase PglX [Enterobacter mori]MCU3986646.1 BREX-1 system adenine-specific DNA-methyltransferase PglX [Enterobacter mori]
MSQLENKNMDKNFYRASAADFMKIPSSPIAYWLPKAALEVLENTTALGNITEPRKGMCTRDNDYFVRYWFEISIEKIGFDYTSREKAKESRKKWFPYQKGGDFRLWYGNNLSVVDWEDDGYRLLNMEKLGWKGNSTNHNLNYIFHPAIVWSKITSSIPSFRLSESGFLFDDASGLCHVVDKKQTKSILGFLCGKVGRFYINVINPTLNIQPGNMAAMPYLDVGDEQTIDVMLNISKSDWNSKEISWDFKKLELLSLADPKNNLNKTYKQLYTLWHKITLEFKKAEEYNNQVFINAYGLQNELNKEVSLREISLNCNPFYRYGSNLADIDYENYLQSDTIAELISYTIGCMMGRYSLDREGLVYAHANNNYFKSLIEAGAYSRFPADSDGILPITSEAWFEDDIAARVEEFVRTLWGYDHLEENLQFIADSLCLAAIRPLKKGGETSRETIRRYLSTQFFKDHLKTYKKRPIYWLFSSGKEKAFECLVYLHRYNETTLPRMRTEYVTPLLGQMDSRIERLRLQQNEAETAEAKRIGKEIDSLTKQLTELRSFDDQLKHYADMKIQLDLDDGVKVNYGKFGTLLAEVKAITGDKAE